jgi:cytoskeletal protein CcmA (bactofilin family)
MVSSHNFWTAIALCTLTVSTVASSGVGARGASSGRQAAVTDDVVQDDLLRAGRTVRVDAEVEGDVAAAGSDVTVSAPVKGYVMSAGRTVLVEAPVGNDVWAAGERVSIDSSVGNNAMIAGQTVRLQPGATVGHDARLAGGEVRSEARVAHDLTISAGRAEIGGDIGGEVNASARQVTVLPDAVVRGDLIVRAPEPPVISPGAQVMGNVDYQRTGGAGWWLAWPVLWGFLFLSLLVLNLIGLYVAPTWFSRVAETLRTRPLLSLLAGAVVLIAIPIVIAILMITLVGIPLAVILSAAYVIALILSAAFVSYRIGLWVFDRLHRTGVSRWSAMVVGALLVSLAVSLPIVGWLIALAIMLIGAGALAVDWRDRLFRIQPA